MTEQNGFAIPVELIQSHEFVTGTWVLVLVMYCNCFPQWIYSSLSPSVSLTCKSYCPFRRSFLLQELIWISDGPSKIALLCFAIYCPLWTDVCVRSLDTYVHCQKWMTNTGCQSLSHQRASWHVNIIRSFVYCSMFFTTMKKTSPMFKCVSMDTMNSRHLWKFPLHRYLMDKHWLHILFWKYLMYDADYNNNILRILFQSKTIWCHWSGNLHIWRCTKSITRKFRISIHSSDLVSPDLCELV